MTRDLGIEGFGNLAGATVARVPGPGRWAGGVLAALASLVAAVVAVRPTSWPAVAGAVIMVGGKAVAFVQAVLGMQWPRPLTDDEVAHLSTVYAESVDLSLVRLVPGRAGVFSLNKRPFTLGNTIYLKNAGGHGVLVHECAHVWQYQHLGGRYTFDALWAQLTVKPDAYRWTDELDRGREHWRDFNREAQAQFLEDLAEAGLGWFVVAGVDHTELARETLAEVRGLS